MNIDQEIVRILRSEPATFVDCCKILRVDYGAIDAAFLRLKREGRIVYSHKQSAWRAAL